MFISTSFNDTQYAGLLLGVLAVTIAFLFTIGIAPFHMWLSDMNQGSPTSITVVFTRPSTGI